MLVRTSAIGSKNAALSNKPLSAVPEPDCPIIVSGIDQGSALTFRAFLFYRKHRGLGRFFGSLNLACGIAWSLRG